MNKDRIRASGHNSPVDSLSRRGSQEKLPSVKHSSAEDSSSTEVSGLEPEPTSSTQPPDSTVTTSAKKLTKRVSSSSSGSLSSSASGNQPATTQPMRVVVHPSDEVSEAEVSSSSETRACCPPEVAYIVKFATGFAVLATLAVILGAFSDKFDDGPDSMALRSDLPLTTFGTFLLSWFVGGLLGKAYYQNCVRVPGRDL